MKRSTFDGLRKFGKAAILSAAALMVTPAVAGDNAQQNNGQGKSRYIIQYTPANEQALKNLVTDMDGDVVFDYSSLFDAFAADLSPDALRTVRTSGLATKIEDDEILTLHKQGAEFDDGGVPDIAPDAIPAGFPDGNFDEFVPWGRDRVQADVVWSVGPNFGPADNGVAAPDVAPGSVTGEGVVVGVLDTGIDYNHPDLADNIIDLRGSGVVRDFLGPDDDATDDTFNGHGTSVASVIASVDNEVGLIGVAPGAKIIPYRVCDSGCPLSAIIGGLVQAVADEVDVINMSFGGGAGKNFEAKAIQAANQAGVVLVASAGNDSSQQVHFPAGYDTVLAVGATDINDNPASFTNVGGWVDVTGPGVNNPTATCNGCVVEAIVEELSPTAQSFSANPMSGSPVAAGPGIDNVSAEIVDADPVNLGCSPIAADLTGRIALISRGACSFRIKVTNAEAAGAAATVIYNNAPGNFNGTLGAGPDSIGPAVSISQADGQTLVAEIASETTTANVDVFRSDTLYWFISGTSFSGPHVAGVAALVKSVNPDLSPIEVRKIIETTAEPIGPKVIFGAGMVRADSAVNAAN